jgi:integrase
LARSLNRLNALQVKRLAKPGLHPDGGNLYLNVSASGAKSWRVIYNRDGKRIELGIGRLTGVSLADARERAAEARRLLSLGLDPKQVWRENSAPKRTHTFGSVALDLISDREAGWKNAKHRQQWRNTLRTYANSIWDKPVADVDVEDVLAILRPIWSQRQETARRVRGRIEAVLNAAKVRGLRFGENPAMWRGNLELLLSRHRKGARRHHSAMSFEEVPQFMAELARRPATAARALEFTILTAARTSEVLNAKWSEVDLKGELWTVPAERMKSGKEHRVPLSASAVELLNSLPRSSDFLFPAPDPEKPLSNMAMAMLLRRMCRSETVHGFRSSFRDWCGEMTQFPREVAEQALAHTVGSEVERAYRRGDALQKRRELMAAWAEFVGGGTPQR